MTLVIKSSFGWWCTLQRSNYFPLKEVRASYLLVQERLHFVVTWWYFIPLKDTSCTSGHRMRLISEITISHHHIGLIVTIPDFHWTGSRAHAYGVICPEGIINDRQYRVWLLIANTGRGVVARDYLCGLSSCQVLLESFLARRATDLLRVEDLIFKKLESCLLLLLINRDALFGWHSGKVRWCTAQLGLLYHFGDVASPLSAVSLVHHLEALLRRGRMHLKQIREVPLSMRGRGWHRPAPIAPHLIHGLFPLHRVDSRLCYQTLLHLCIIHDPLGWQLRLLVTIPVYVVGACNNINGVFHGAIVCRLDHDEARQIQGLSVFLIAHMIRIQSTISQAHRVLVTDELLQLLFLIYTIKTYVTLH